MCILVLNSRSHNFRPSYFRLGCVLKQRMGVSCILGLTATATKETELSILNALCIPSTGLVQAAHVRQNLHLSVSRPSHRYPLYAPWWICIHFSLKGLACLCWWPSYSIVCSLSTLLSNWLSWSNTGGQNYLLYFSLVHSQLWRASSFIAPTRWMEAWTCSGASHCVRLSSVASFTLPFLISNWGNFNICLEMQAEADDISRYLEDNKISAKVCFFSDPKLRLIMHDVTRSGQWQTS